MRSGELGKFRKLADHTVRNVFSEMLRQIVRDYGSLPDPYAMSLGEIEFWYQGLVPELMKATKPTG